MLETWQSQIKASAAKGEKLAIKGSGSKSFLSPASEGATLDTRAHAGVVEYDPKELVIVVKCGTRVADVEKAMADAGQMLAFEPPHFGDDATIGGMVATGVSGPRRAYAGAVRDFVLGAKVIDGKGDHLSFGGKVMKNVAGFDVSRLLCGSYGTLGLVTEVAFKCLPLPKAQATRVFEMDAAKAIEAMNRWYADADPITATTWVDGKLYVRFAGAEPAVKLAVEKRGGEALANDGDWWRDWREQRHAFFANATEIHRVSCKSTAPVPDGMQTATEWGGALRWVHANEENAAKIRYQAQRAGGYASVWRGSASAHTNAVESLSQPLKDIHAKLKASFDPYNVFATLPLGPAAGAGRSEAAVPTSGRDGRMPTEVAR
jgi:glycolate oxidase FAD binding subunit